MPNVSRTKTWVSDEVLTAAHLNAEFNGILAGINDNALDNDNLSQTDDYLLRSLVLGSGVAAGAGDGQLHVHVSSAGSVAAHADANDLVVESSANTGMTLLSGASATGSIHFGDTDNDVGSIVYTHGTDMAFTVETAEVLSLAAAAATFKKPVTVGVDDTGHDVKFFGASAGAYMEWDESADQLRIMGASADATTSTGKLLLATSLTNINANDVLGKIDFQAPHEAGGTDAITVAASIQAIAQGTFAADLNATDLIFYTGHSEAATEKLRITSQGEIGIGGANYGSDGQVLTSGGAGVAPAWETPTTGDITGVTAGNGLSGGGTSGGVTLALDLSELTDTAIANGDYIVFTDATDSNATVKGDLADVATLFAGTGLTASSSVIGVDAAQTGITSLLATNIKIGEDDQTKIDFETANQINFYSNNAEAMRIDSSQNVGIGTGAAGDTIAANLHIVDSGTTSTRGGNILIGDGVSSGDEAIELQYDMDNSNMFTLSTWNGTTETIVLNTYVGGNKLMVGPTTTAADGTLHVHTATAGSVTAHADHDDLVIENSNDVGITMLCPAAYHGGIAVGDADQNRRGWLIYDNGTSLNGVSDSWSFGTAATERMVIGNGGTVGIGGDVSSPYDTIGLHINQAGNDDTTLQIVSTDISHGLNSAYYGAYDSDAYMAIRKQHASQGGLTLTALGTDSALTNPMVIQVLGGTAQTSKNTSGIGLMDIVCAEHNGSGALSDITADGNIFSVRCRVSTSLAAKFLVDEDGDIYYDGSAAAYDSMADAELVRTFDTVMAPKEIIQSKWDEDVRYNEQSLIDAGILGGPVIGVPHDERGMVCMTQLQRLHNGAIWQTHTEVQQMKEDFALKLDEKEARISALETQIQGLLN